MRAWFEAGIGATFRVWRMVVSIFGGLVVGRKSSPESSGSRRNERRSLYPWSARDKAQSTKTCVCVSEESESEEESPLSLEPAIWSPTRMRPPKLARASRALSYSRLNLLDTVWPMM